MNKILLWILTFVLLTPQLSFANCPEKRKPGWNFSEALLYWKGREKGLGYTNKPADVLTTDNFTKNSVVPHTFDWELGFRTGAGYTQANQHWSYQAFWTYIKSKAHGHRHFNSGAPDFEGIYPIWSMGPDTLSSDYVSSASSHWHLSTNIVDLFAQFHYHCFHNRLALMPFLGPRGTSLNQKLTAKYSDGTFFSGEDLNTLHSHYYGAGPRLGFDVNCYLACGFSLFGRAAAAPLFGQLHIKQKETYLDSTRFYRSKREYHFILSADYAAGLKWKRAIIKPRPCISLSLAWEGQDFFFANPFYRGKFHFFDKERTLFLHGITLSAALDF